MDLTRLRQTKATRNEQMQRIGKILPEMRHILVFELQRLQMRVS